MLTGVVYAEAFVYEVLSSWPVTIEGLNHSDGGDDITSNHSYLMNTYYVPDPKLDAS